MSSSLHGTRVQAARDRLAEALRAGAPTGAYRAAIANLDASAAAAVQREVDKRAADAAAAEAAAEVEIEARTVQIASEARAGIEVAIERFQYRPATHAAMSEAKAAPGASDDTGNFETTTQAVKCAESFSDVNTVASEATTSQVIETGPAADAPTGAAGQAEVDPTINIITKETDHV